jgi:HEPN domain-containing protein
MKNKEDATKWLKRAKSNLERAKIGRVNDEILYEDLCYDCQQAVEKSLKALLIGIDKEFPFTHSISRLLELLNEEQIEISEDIKQSIVLTDYAVKTRYPGEIEPVTKEEYDEAVKLATLVYEWVTQKIN